MSEIPPHLVEVGASFAPGYVPVLDFHGWRVAMLRHADMVTPERFQQVERHRKTNEVFILTAGQADLIVCDGDDQPGEPHLISMDLNIAYNIGQAVWHHVVMSPEAHIILVERSDTSQENSDYVQLAPEVVAALKQRFSV